MVSNPQKFMATRLYMYMYMLCKPLKFYTIMTKVSFTRPLSNMNQPLNHLWCQICLLFSHFCGEIFTRFHQVALHYSERERE
jgi:hypothetical protein